MRIPVIALVGRPNVGKSTLFNRLVQRRQAVVDDTPGITRDRHVGLAEWAGQHFYVIDTGGWDPGAREGMVQRIADQVMLALGECDAVFFLTDAREGLQPADEEISRALHRQADSLPVLLLVNKSDSERWEAHRHEFRQLGWPDLAAVSAMDGRGLGEALDLLLERLPAGGGMKDPGEGIRVAVIGRPNVGKSSLTNRLLGQERVIVDERPGTTRDAIDVPWRWQGRTFWLIDTAGIRHNWGNLPGFEFYASLRSIRALNRCDVALLLIDAAQKVTRQDQRIASIIEESGRPTMILVNKWDLVAKDTHTMKEYTADVREALSFLVYAPLLFVSALSGQRASKIAEQIVQLHAEAQKRVPTRELNQVLRRAIDRNPPRGGRGRQAPNILYATQVRTGPPLIVLFTRRGERIGDAYLRYLSRQLRDALGFEGSPIRLRVRAARRRERGSR